MRIAITASGPTINDQVDPRFGRAQYILILDDAGSVIEAVDNAQGRNAMQGAGIQTSKLIADRKVDVLLTGHCGPNAFRTLQAAGIRVGVDQTGTVRTAYERLKRDEVSFIDEPNVEAHW